MSENNAWQRDATMLASNYPSSQELMDVRGVAELLHLNRQTIYNWLHQRKLTGIKVGGVWRFDRRRIESWLQVQTVEAGVIDRRQPHAPTPPQPAEPAHGTS